MERLINAKEVAKRLGVTVCTLWRYEQNSNFPKPIRLDCFGNFVSPKSGKKAGTRRWREVDIDNFILKLKEQADAVNTADAC